MFRCTWMLLFVVLLPGICLKSTAENPGTFGATLLYESGSQTGYVEWDASYGHIYFIQYSDDLRTWSYYPRIEVGDGHRPAQPFNSTAEKLFFRIIRKDAPPAGEDPETLDFDGDGVTNLDELNAGTDPFENIDANGNSLPDDWEIFHSVTDSSEDSDGDGLTALQEYEANSNPNDFFNGAIPNLEEVDGPPDSLSVRVTASDGSPVSGAPIEFEAVIGEHLLAETPAGSGLPVRVVHSGADGIATVYFVAP